LVGDAQRATLGELSTLMRCNHAIAATGLARRAHHAQRFSPLARRGEGTCSPQHRGKAYVGIGALCRAPTPRQFGTVQDTPIGAGCGRSPDRATTRAQPDEQEREGTLTHVRRPTGAVCHRHS
jgi:hypothetical protein